MIEDLDLIRRFRAGVYEPGPEVQENARQRLAEAMIQEQLDQEVTANLGLHSRLMFVRRAGRSPEGDARPKVRTALVTVVVMLLAGAGFGYVIATHGSPSGNVGLSSTAGSTVCLAGYTAHLPTGYAVTETKAADCRTYPGTAAVPAMQESAPDAITTPKATACIGSFLSATYGLGSTTVPSPDLDAPSATTTVNVGPYPARIGGAGIGFTIVCGNVQGQPPSCPPADSLSSPDNRPLGLWVQVPSIGGGYHDLIVGSWGLTAAQLIAIVQSALPHHRVAAPAGVPPWTLIPSCAPGQTPNGNPDSAQPCGPSPGNYGMRPGRRPRRVATRCQGASRNGGTRYRCPRGGIRPG